MAMAIAVNYAYYVRFDFRFYSLCALKIIYWELKIISTL